MSQISMCRLQTYTEKYEGEGRLSGLPLMQTHFGVIVETWVTAKFPVLLCISIEGAFCQSLFDSPRPHTPCRLKFTLRSLTQITVLHFVLRLSFCQTHDFLKNSSIAHPATVFFLFRNLSCTRNLIKPHCFWEGNENFFQGPQPPPPPPRPHPSSDTTRTPPPATPLALERGASFSIPQP